MVEIFMQVLAAIRMTSAVPHICV